MSLERLHALFRRKVDDLNDPILASNCQKVAVGAEGECRKSSRVFGDFGKQLLRLDAPKADPAIVVPGGDIGVVWPKCDGGHPRELLNGRNLAAVGTKPQ